MNIRKLHDATLVFNNGTGTQSSINYTTVMLRGVKIDTIDAYSASKSGIASGGSSTKYGYSNADDIRLLIYLDDVMAYDDDGNTLSYTLPDDFSDGCGQWTIRPKDYFANGCVTFTGDIGEFKKSEKVFCINKVAYRTLIPYIEAYGR